MATVEDIDTDLTLELDGSGVTPERFQRAVRAFFGVLSEVTKEVCQGQSPVRWQVKVKAGSNLIGVVPTPGFRPDIVGMIATAMHDGVDALEREADLPPMFSQTAARYARDLGELVESDPKRDIRIKLWADRRPVAVTRQTALTTDALEKGQYEDHGSVDGRLQTVTERGAMRFMVYETLSDRGITCYLSHEQADEAVRSWRKRVEVYGRITYRRDGTPVSIKVEEIVPFPDMDSIPDFQSVRGILRRE